MAVKSICGVILVANDCESLARFYGEVFDLEFEREEHGDLAPHYGVNIGACHFAIHPPANMAREAVGNASTSVALNVDNLDDIVTRLKERGGRCLQAIHDEGFGRTTTWLDLEGNPVEAVELNYDFDAAK